MDSQKFCLKWDGFQGNVTSVFDHLRQDSELVDVTLCCEGQRVRAHRMMLSACSPYFRELFKDLSCQQLVIFLKDTSAADLTAIVEFMYKGSVNVAQSQLASFIKTAEMLQVQGLSGGDDKEPPPSPAPPEPSRGGWSQPPGSPAGGLRRPADTAAAASPSEPRHKRRRPEPPPPPPPPPPPAAAAAAAVAERKVSPPPPTAGAAAVGAPRQEDAPQEQTAVQFENVVKVEKFDVDLTLDDEDAVAGDGGGGGDDLEAALGHVSHYEGYDAGSDQSLSADGQLFRTAAAAVGVGDGALSAAALAAGGPFTPGTSQRAGEDTIQVDHGSPARCHICGTSYTHHRTLVEHMKKHRGETRCPVCRLEFAVMRTMRRHMVSQHGLSQQEVDRVTNKRPKMSDSRRPPPVSGQRLGETS